MTPDTRRAHGARCDGPNRCEQCRAADRADEQRQQEQQR